MLMEHFLHDDVGGKCKVCEMETIDNILFIKTALFLQHQNNER